MSARLEQHGVYLLPDAIDGTEYVLLEAVQDQDGWHLIETHAASHAKDRFNDRSGLPAEQLLRYTVASDGTLVEQTSSGSTSGRRFTLANLSLMGYLRDGTYVSAAEAQ